MHVLRFQTHGADADGLICGFRFGTGEAGVPVDAATALRSLDSFAGESGFVWLHFNLAHGATEHWLRAHASHSEAFLEALRDGARSTRVELDDDMLVAVVNDVHYAFAFEPSDIATLWLLVTPRMDQRQGGATAFDRPTAACGPDRYATALKLGSAGAIDAGAR